MIAGSLLTDTQGHLIFTEENRQRGRQRETVRGMREIEGMWETDKREVKTEKQKLCYSKCIDQECVF